MTVVELKEELRKRGLKAECSRFAVARPGKEKVPHERKGSLRNI